MVSITLKGYKDRATKFGENLSKGIVEVMEKTEKKAKEKHDFVLKQLKNYKARGDIIQLY